METVNTIYLKYDVDDIGVENFKNKIILVNKVYPNATIKDKKGNTVDIGKVIGDEFKMIKHCKFNYYYSVKSFDTYYDALCELKYFELYNNDLSEFDIEEVVNQDTNIIKLYIYAKKNGGN